jgi:2-aminobenzoate-CoA ligase
MPKPPTGPTAHLDTFAGDNLPPEEEWPELLWDLPELDYPPVVNVATELLDRHVTEGRGERPALRAGATSWSYRELKESADRVARVLVEDLGLVPGNRVLLRGFNDAMSLACWFGILKAGGIVVATMPLLRARELAVMAEKARTRFALCDRRLSEELTRAKAVTAVLERTVGFGPGPAADRGELEERMAAKTGGFENVATAADDVCLIAFTSGTTGKPKGTMHFHRDLLASADSFFRGTLPAGPEDVFCGSAPLAFTFGLGMEVVFPFRIGASAVFCEKPSPEALLQTVEEAGVTVLATAPTAYRAMLPHLERYDLSSLRLCVSAGETLPRPTWEAWHRVTGLGIVDGIGSTEMFHIFISAAGDDIRPGATGRPVRGYQAMVVDEDFRPVPPGGVGRLAVRGPTGCRYLADERQREYVVNGWNLTGDTYRVDEDGYFWFEARSDDMILSSGYNISAPEVEDALLEHPAVAECAVVATPDEERGSLVKAFVVLAAGVEPAEGRGGESRPDDLVKELQAFVKERIAPYKYPRAIELVDALPRTETGKVQRFKLRQREEERARERAAAPPPIA